MMVTKNKRVTTVINAFHNPYFKFQVTNLSEYDTYRSNMVAWEREKERQSVEFTITEDDPYADGRVRENPEVGCLSILGKNKDSFTLSGKGGAFIGCVPVFTKSESCVNSAFCSV